MSFACSFCMQRESHGVDYDQKILRNQFEDQQKKLRDLDNRYMYASAWIKPYTVHVQ